MRRAAAKLAPASPAQLSKVSEQDSHEQRDHDHDDQWSLARAEDPIDLYFFHVEYGEQSHQHRKHHKCDCAGKLAATAARTGINLLGTRGRGHEKLMVPVGLTTEQPLLKSYATELSRSLRAVQLVLHPWTTD